MAEELLIVEEPAPHVRRLTLNRPDRLNTMTAELCEALHEQLREIERDRSCRAVVLTGAGRGFCAGLDLAGYGRGARQRRQRRVAGPARPTSSTCRVSCSGCGRCRSR